VPIIKIDLFEGKTVDQKRRAAKGITDVCCSEFGLSPESVRIIFNDMKKEDFAVGGKLSCDK